MLYYIHLPIVFRFVILNSHRVSCVLCRIDYKNRENNKLKVREVNKFREKESHGFFFAGGFGLGSTRK